MEKLKALATDTLTTFLWVFTFTALTSAPSLLPTSSTTLTFSLNIPLVAILTSAFDVLLGSGSYNPCSSLAFHLASPSPPSHPLSLALHLPFQATASALALHSLLSLVPPHLHHHLFRPTISASTIPTASATEMILTFLITFAILHAVDCWPRRTLLRNSVLSLLNAVLALPGAELTGASMNPITAFAWAYVAGQHKSWDQLLVYWVGPFAGASAAGLLYRSIGVTPMAQRRRGGSRRVETSRLYRPSKAVVAAARRLVDAHMSVCFHVDLRDEVERLPLPRAVGLRPRR